jgi:nitrate/nitrite transporter NarK
MAQIRNRGWSVTFAGLGINLALGILYTWSIFKLSIQESITLGDGKFNWDMASLNDPYAVCCLVFAFAMIPAGRLQDKFSPRVTAIIGGLLTGAGLIIISQSTSLFSWILGFGVFAGMGIGFAYASATPPAIKWFPAAKTGMIAGIVVAGFGLASVYIAPLSNYLINQVGLSSAMMIFGISFLILVCLLSVLLVNPPEDYVPEVETAKARTASKPAPKIRDYKPSEMLKTGSFFRLWLMYFVGAGAGLFIIGGVASLAKQSMGQMAWVVVALLAVGNAGGRVVAGILSDKIGRNQTLFLMLVFQSLIIFSLLFIDQSIAFLVVLAATLIGFNYGTNLSLFPSLTKDYFGLKNFGSNYGLIFSAWGMGGFVFPRIAQMLVARTGSYNTAYIITAGLLLVSAFLAITVKAPAVVPEPEKILVATDSKPEFAG